MWKERSFCWCCCDSKVAFRWADMNCISNLPPICIIDPAAVSLALSTVAFLSLLGLITDQLLVPSLEDALMLQPSLSSSSELVWQSMNCGIIIFNNTKQRVDREILHSFTLLASYTSLGQDSLFFLPPCCTPPLSAFRGLASNSSVQNFC